MIFRIYNLLFIFLKFDSNRAGSFGDYVSNKNGYRRQTNDRHREQKTTFSYSRGPETSRKHKNGKSPDGLDYYTSLVYAQEVKNKNDFNQ